MKFTSSNRKKFALFFMIFLVTPFLMMAQDGKIKLSGKVLDETNAPLPGANVQLKNSSKSVTTDAEGKFTFSVSEANGVFIVSYVGYKSKEVRILGESFMEIKLELEEQLPLTRVPPRVFILEITTAG